MDKETTIKIMGVVIPPLSALAATILMLKFAPPKTMPQLAHRLIASVLSSLTIGVMVIMWIYGYHPNWLDAASLASSDLFGLAEVGKLFVLGCVFFICGLPGWWLVAGIGKWLEKHSKKAIEDALNRLSEKFGGDK